VHLADGILRATPLVVGLNLVGGAALGVALERSLCDRARYAAWTGTLAAFVLAAQALNLPLLPGASAHVVGTALLTLALGPARAIVALSAVLVVQALLLADGGVTVLGINLLNLAVLPALAAELARRLSGESARGRIVAAVAGTLLGNVAGACSLAATLVAGTGAPAKLTFAWLIGVQGLAGLAEGVLTALVVKHLLGRAPALLGAPARFVPRALDDQPAPGARPRRRALAIAIVVAIALVPFATATPDALELVLGHIGAGP
jgi:cobalt/nickel transport system permease protein